MQLQRILAPVDFSPHSLHSLEHAADMAAAAGATLHILHVAADEANGDHDREILERLGRLLAPESVLRLPPSELKVLNGAPYRTICQYARDQQADIIVMATRGRSAWTRWTIGSVVERVIRDAPCPVLVINDEAVSKSSPERSAVVPLESEMTTNSQAVDLIERGLRLRATDIHIDPIGPDHDEVRMRIDGRLERYCHLDGRVAEHLKHQLLLAGDLDIAEPFSPQEGRLKLPAPLAETEVRMTTCPVVGGTAIALRLFARSSIFFPLDSLGLSPNIMPSIQQMLRAGEGLVLVTGPTGSGKTTTVYSMLEMLRNDHGNIVSIEDPVEFAVSFVRQMSVDARHAITMTDGLRTLLRMDPDVIFVGEVRDAEAAQIAMRAASSGRYVFSTLHTRDVASTITAFRDLHVEHRSLAANLTGIINQRLLRRLCQHCATRAETSEAQRGEFESFGVNPPDQIAVAHGCDKCRGTGYQGRVGAFEVALSTPSLSSAIADGCSEEQLRQIVREYGAVSLTHDALSKVCDGITTLEEALGMRWL